MKKILSILLISIMLFGLAACEDIQVSDDPQPTLSENLVQNSDKIAKNQSLLEKTQPAPVINYSNERANLIKRATTFNDPNKVSYIYLITKAGTIVAFYTVKGKVSSLSSYLVSDEQIVNDPYFDTRGSEGSTQSAGGIVVQAPDIDGSYGTNGGGIFFYTTDDTYVEWNGEYMLCDKPLKLTTQPILNRDVN